LSDLVGGPVSLWPLQPASRKAHYRRAQPGAAIVGWLSRFRLMRRLLQTAIRYTPMGAGVRADFSRAPDEPLPDLSAMPPELFEFTSPPGTYFDAFPIHLLTTSSLDALARLRPEAAWDVRRFRPNFLLDTGDGAKGLMESQWQGRSVRMGALILQCEIPTV